MVVTILSYPGVLLNFWDLHRFIDDIAGRIRCYFAEIDVFTTRYCNQCLCLVWTLCLFLNVDSSQDNILFNARVVQNKFDHMFKLSKVNLFDWAYCFIVGLPLSVNSIYTDHHWVKLVWDLFTVWICHKLYNCMYMYRNVCVKTLSFESVSPDCPICHLEMKMQYDLITIILPDINLYLNKESFVFKKQTCRF